jgi:hypothetical protein
MPTANAYADGQMSVPSASGASRKPSQGCCWRRDALGVGGHTPTATLGVLPAVGIAGGHVSQKSRPTGHRHGVTNTPTATFGVLPAVGVCPVYAEGGRRCTTGRQHILCDVFYLITVMYCIYTYLFNNINNSNMVICFYLLDKFVPFNNSLHISI